MVNNLSYSIIFLLLHLSFPLIGQDTIIVPISTGNYAIDNNTNENIAYKNALELAKVDALRKAGITEIVSVESSNIQSQSDNEYSNFSSISSTINLKGSVIGYDSLKQVKKINEFNQFTIELNLYGVKVIEHNDKEDLNFSAEIKGIQAAYFHKDKINFSITPTQKCYVRIFLFSETNAWLLYPNELEIDKILNQGELFTFPKVTQIEFLADKNIEFHTMLVILLKEPFITTNEISYEEITNWISKIQKSKRKVYYFNFIIKQK